MSYRKMAEVMVMAIDIDSGVSLTETMKGIGLHHVEGQALPSLSLSGEFGMRQDAVVEMADVGGFNVLHASPPRKTPTSRDDPPRIRINDARRQQWREWRDSRMIENHLFCSDYPPFPPSDSMLEWE